MSEPGVTVVDYGIGNLRSVCRALEFSGGQVDLTGRPDKIVKADRLVLPGVGAFAKCIDELQQRGLTEPLLEFFEGERPFLGICVGMQMMMESSGEFGRNEGFGLIPGSVEAIPRPNGSQCRYKVPHVGWDPLMRPESADWAESILADCQENDPVYFVHSYTAQPTSESHRLADSDYFGVRVSAVIQEGHRYGCQFHPEKSGETGLCILRKFLSL
ncbi:MAG: imidazole glycerol phosphate synthase subunit HisH [Alphaproteobacteria bacterium]|nr:imidazole glycerol phosphate synthase subunit HisH [Alphaproteobacteria bacterium]